MIKNVLFDLDGTIINCTKLQVGVLQRLFDLYDVDASNIDFLQLIGPPLINTFGKYFGEDKKYKVMADYNNIYKEVAVHDVTLMPDIVFVLDYLKANGYRLFVTSLQIESVVKKELSTLGVLHYFDKVYGDNVDNPYQSKGELIKSILIEQALIPEQTVVVGDTTNDLLGGKENGLRTIAVSWGYGADSVMSEKNFAESGQQLLNIISNM